MENKPDLFKRRYFMCDYARQRSFIREEFVLWLDALARLGYNGIGLYIEGAFDFEGIPGVIREGVITKEDAAFAVKEGKARGIKVFPMTNVVGHMEHFFRQERFRDLCAPAEDYMQMNFADPRAEAFAMQIVRELAAAFDSDFVHVGGDEVTLTEDERIPYACFLAKICKNLLDDGITPGIWNDMIWMDTPLCEYFDRRTMIFDWNYYGHRKESPAYFESIGFSDVVVCPCDNMWEGFISYQRLTGHLKASRDIPVKPYEVEAFFADAVEVACPNGMVTDWNNENGANMWAQWTAFARGGLFMNGKLSAGEENDELIENHLFGRVTPYSAVTRLLQNALPYDDSFSTMRHALFSPSHLKKLYAVSVASAGKRTLDFDGAAEEVEKMLDDWKVEGDFETCCADALYAVAALIRASSVLLAAFDLHTVYTEAAICQFDDKTQADEKLSRIADAFRHAAKQMGVYGEAHKKAIEKTGHNRYDLVRLSETILLVKAFADAMDDMRRTLDRIPLPRFERIVDRIVERKFIVT